MKAPIFGKNFATKLFVIIVLVTDDFLFNCKKLTDILNKKGLKDFQLFHSSLFPSIFYSRVSYLIF